MSFAFQIREIISQIIMGELAIIGENQVQSLLGKHHTFQKVRYTVCHVNI